jgi:hypothetical protein
MSNGIILSVIKDIEKINNETHVEQYTIVNVRPSEKILVMIDIMMKISGKNYSSVISEIISSQLVNIAASDIEYAEPILNTAEQLFNEGDRCFQKDCAFDILCRKGYIKYELAPDEHELKSMDLLSKMPW